MGALEFLSVFVLGLTGTGHCVGMCGAFAVAAGAGPGGAGTLFLRQVSYQIGKATSYVFIGVILTLGAASVSVQSGTSGFGVLLGWVVGGLMIVLGAAQLSGIRIGPRAEKLLSGPGFCSAAFAVARAPTVARSLLIGWINGFLPCGLSIAALLYLASFGSVLGTTVGAYVFGLGTLPGLWLLAAFGNRLSVRHRAVWVKVSAIALILLGAVTLFRGVPEFHHWVHKHLAPGSGTHSSHEEH